jgi:ABC-type amino acid transport substrate-binding protein
MRLHHLKFFVFFFCLNFASAADKISIRVGGYNFPPFVEQDGQAGIVSDLIKKLNSSQEKFLFSFVSTSANRRYRDLKDKKMDLIFFEDESWSWNDPEAPHLKTGVIVNGGEMFVALNKDSRNQKYFDSFNRKKIRGIFGYHYNFANMKTDPELLRKKGISLGQSNEENLKDLLEERIDIIVMNSFVIENKLKEDPSLKDKLLISTKKDQTYQLRVMLNTQSQISAEEIEKLTLANLK